MGVATVVAVEQNDETEAGTGLYVYPDGVNVGVKGDPLWLAASGGGIDIGTGIGGEGPGVFIEVAAIVDGDGGGGSRNYGKAGLGESGMDQYKKRKNEKALHWNGFSCLMAGHFSSLHLSPAWQKV